MHMSLNLNAEYSNILLTKAPRSDVENFTTLVYSFLGEESEQFGNVNAASKEDFEYSKGFAEVAGKLLEEGKIRAHPVECRQGGLDAMLQGLEDLRAKRVNGRKLVISL